MAPSTPDGPLLISDIEQRCRSYHTEHHLQAVIDPRTRHIQLLIEGILAAIIMPATLGHRVLAGLRVRMLAGPVIVSTTTRQWTFLTGPAYTPCETTLVDLLRLDVIIPAAGDRITLPSPDDERVGIRFWENPPSTRDLPPHSAVIATIRAMAQ